MVFNGINNLSKRRVFVADEVFLTGTDIDNKVIGDGKAGPVFAKLLEVYREAVKEQGAVIFK